MLNIKTAPKYLFLFLFTFGYPFTSYATDVNVWQTWSPKMMIAGLSEANTHPGAIRAYKELGWWDLRKAFKPVVLPK